MSNNFNAGQFVNYFLQQYTVKLLSNKTVGANSSANNIFEQTVATPKPIIQLNEMQLKNMVEIPKLQLDMLNSLDKSALVKDLMNMPQDFGQLINKFAINLGETQKQIIDMTKLINFLQESTTQGKQNLLNLIVTINKAGFTQTEQLKELNYIINACVPGTQTSAEVIMKNLILLYLPWLPLGDGAGFDIEFKQNKEEKGGEEDDSVMIYIKTLHFGSLKIILQVENKTKILININCDENFPKNIAEKIFKQEVEGYNINTQFEYSQTKQKENEDEEEEKTSQTKVTVNTSKHINPLLMMAAHSVIRIVFEIDKSVIEKTSDKESA